MVDSEFFSELHPESYHCTGIFSTTADGQGAGGAAASLVNVMDPVG